MHELLLIILFSLVGGALSVIAVAALMVFPGHFRESLLPHFVSFAIGALLGAALLSLIPHTISGPNALEVHHLGLTLLLGILGFFLMEKMVLWRHCHSDHCEAHTPGHQHLHTPSEQHREKATATLVLIGDAMHNLVDGVLIAAAFLTDEHVGIMTALAVAAHEVPQEVGDFAILLKSGLSRRKAFMFNLLSSLTTVIGAVIAYYSLVNAEVVVPYVVAVAASSFLYIAVADLIPGLHKHVEVKQTLMQMSLIVAGVLLIYFMHSFLH